MSARQTDSFLDHFVLAVPGFRGKVFVLSGFFDDTEIRVGPPAFGVAGILYTVDGLNSFNKAWSPKLSGLTKPYRTSDCMWRNGAFENWEYPERDQFMKGLAKTTAENRDAGFTTMMPRSEYE